MSHKPNFDAGYEFGAQNVKFKSYRDENSRNSQFLGDGDDECR